MFLSFLFMARSLIFTLYVGTCTSYAHTVRSRSVESPLYLFCLYFISSCFNALQNRDSSLHTCIQKHTYSLSHTRIRKTDSKFAFNSANSCEYATMYEEEEEERARYFPKRALSPCFSAGIAVLEFLKCHSCCSLWDTLLINTCFQM